MERFPREPDMLVYGLRTAATAALRVWLRMYHRYQIVGRENLPTTGSFIMVANHTSHLDTASIISALPMRKLHRIFPAAAQDYFFVTPPRAAFSAIVVNALPFDRKINIRQSLNLCKQILQTPGNVLLLFPEGTRSVTGELQEFKPGIGMLLAGSPHPVIPCHLVGAFEALPKGRCIPRPRKLRLTIGEPKSFASLKRGKSTALSICEELHHAVRSLENS